MIYVEFGPNQVFTGTAFAITADGVMITNRHVVAGPDGTRHPTRVDGLKRLRGRGPTLWGHPIDHLVTAPCEGASTQVSQGAPQPPTPAGNNPGEANTMN